MQILVDLGDNLALKSVIIQYNDTGLPSDKALLLGISKAILEDNKINEVVQEAKEIVGKE